MDFSINGLPKLNAKFLFEYFFLLQTKKNSIFTKGIGFFSLIYSMYSMYNSPIDLNGEAIQKFLFFRFFLLLPIRGFDVSWQMQNVNMIVWQTLTFGLPNRFHYLASYDVPYYYSSVILLLSLSEVKKQWVNASLFASAGVSVFCFFTLTFNSLPG